MTEQDPLPLDAPAPSEEEAWARVLVAWEDEAAHRAYLARFADLTGLAAAGGRYREVLERHPDDAVARRMREEIVKRATVLGLATLPRTQPVQRPPWLRRLVQVAGAAFGLLAVWAVYRLVLLLGARS